MSFIIQIRPLFWSGRYPNRVSHLPTNEYQQAAAWSLRTDDPGEFAEKLRPVAGALSVRAQHKSSFLADLTMVRLSRMSLFTVGFSETRVTDLSERDYLSITIPISGSAQMQVGRKSRELSPGSAHVLPRDEVLDYHVSDRPCRSLVLNFDQTFVDSYLRENERRPLERGDQFLPVDERSTRGHRLLRLARFAWGEIDRGLFPDSSSLAARELETTLLAATLDATSLEFDYDPCRSRHIRRATDYLMGHLADPISMAKVAGIAGVSERSLRREFQRAYGMTVAQFLSRRRLEAAHQALQEAEPGETSVTEIATRCGFTHFGRFSGAYRAAFGCMPSESLRS